MLYLIQNCKYIDSIGYCVSANICRLDSFQTNATIRGNILIKALPLGSVFVPKTLWLSGDCYEIWVRLYIKEDCKNILTTFL